MGDDETLLRDVLRERWRLITQCGRQTEEGECDKVKGCAWTNGRCDIESALTTSFLEAQAKHLDPFLRREFTSTLEGRRTKETTPLLKPPLSTSSSSSSSLSSRPSLPSASSASSSSHLLKEEQKVEGSSTTTTPTPRRLLPKILSFDTKSSCTDGGDFTRKEKLGSGGYGTIYKACLSPSSSTRTTRPKSDDDDKECKYALKEIDTMADSFALITGKLDAIMLASLQNETYTDHKGQQKPLVPRYYNAWTCPDRFTIVMDKWDGNMSHLGLLQRQHYENTTPVWMAEAMMPELDPNDKMHTRVLLFTRPQLQDMFNITKRLDQLGVIHGDLQPNQFLYRGRHLSASNSGSLSATAALDPTDVDIALTDFGLVTTYGWMARTYGCADPFHPRGAQVPRHVRPYFNTWSLAHLLTHFYPTYVGDPDGKSLVASDRPMRFVGLRGDDTKTLSSSLNPADAEMKLLCRSFHSKKVGPSAAGSFSIPFEYSKGLVEEARDASDAMDDASLPELRDLQRSIGQGILSESVLNKRIARYLTQ